MHVNKNDLKSATDQGIITHEQSERLWSFWQAEQADVPQFKMSHVLYYLGGMLSIAAVSIYVTKEWDRLIGFKFCLLTLLLFALGQLLTHKFLTKKLAIPAGIMSTFSLVIVPLAVFNLQLWSGYLPNLNYHAADYHHIISWYWMPMEISTLIVGAIMLYLYRFPFLMFPISITLWYMSMDLYRLFFPNPDNYFSSNANFTMVFGLITLALAFYMDFKHSNNKKDYGFWLYMTGVIMFWSGLTCHDTNSELNKALYCLINLGMIFLSVFVQRRVFAVFGTLGILTYLGHLTMLFADSLSFPIVLVLIGILFIFLATVWIKSEHKLLALFRPYIPNKILERIEN